MKGKIYIIQNNVNSKVYIGKTFQEITTRFNEHKRDSRRVRNEKRKLYDAFNRYGINNFYVECLEDDVDESIINEKELYYIKQYNSLENGYNDDHFKGITISDEEVIKTYHYLKAIKLVAKKCSLSVDTVSLILKKNNIILYNSLKKPIYLKELNINFNSINDCAKYLQYLYSKSKNIRDIKINIKRAIKRNGTYLNFTFEFK